MKADFPSSPAVGAIYTANNVIWTWTGKQWTKVYITSVNAVTKAYVDTSISNLVNGAGPALDTLKELATALGDDASFSTTVTNLIAAKAPIASPTFTGTVAGITAAMVGLGSVTNTSDANKPVSTAQQTALDAKAPIASPTFTGTVTLPSTAITNNLQAVTKAYVDTQLSSATSGGTTKTYVDTQDALKANIASPTFTGTVAGITAAMVGLGNVTNTSDTNKPVSTAQQTALDLKANLTGATFTGAVTAPSFNSTSSIRFKENVAPINDALSIVNKLQGVTFDWKASGQSDMGVIAEQVNEVVPHFVSKDETGTPQAVEYGKFTSILIEAVKQLAKRVEELENK
jgi:hypothetical protein